MTQGFTRRSALAAIAAERLDDQLGRRARGEPLYLRHVNPAASRDFIARMRLRAFRHIAEKDVMMLLPSSMLKEKFRRFAGKTRLFLELAQRGV